MSVKISTMKRGEFYRITSSECCGCVLRETSSSKETCSMLTGLEVVSSDDCLRGALCSISEFDSYEILSPEQAMEIQLSC